MTGTGTPRSSCGRGCGSAPREARRRLALAEDLLPRQGLAGRQPLPPVHRELGAAVAAGEVASRAATIIAVALDRVRHAATPRPRPGWSTP